MVPLNDGEKLPCKMSLELEALLKNVLPLWVLFASAGSTQLEDN